MMSITGKWFEHGSRRLRVCVWRFIRNFSDKYIQYIGDFMTGCRPVCVIRRRQNGYVGV
jgi:hypothetical protein